MFATDDLLRDEEKLATLTAKQREVLDLLVDLHPIKSIASELKISVPAVELRLREVRAKLGVGDSKAAARVYRALLQKCVVSDHTYGKSVPTYGNEVVSLPFMFPHQSGQEQAGTKEPLLRDVTAMNGFAPWAAEMSLPVSSKALIDRFSPFALVAMVVGLAGVIAAVGLTLLAVAEQLQDLKIERLFH